MVRVFAFCAAALFLLQPAGAQVIEYQSNGIQYQMLTRSSVTVTFTPLAVPVSRFSVIQVSVSNGSEGPYTIRPEDFRWERPDGSSLRAEAARDVVELFWQKASTNDVLKLISAYEAGIYNNTRMRSTNGFESRREAALTMGSNRLRAAAMSSALALASVKLAAGESTDGAVFFPTEGKPLGPGTLVVRTNTDEFRFKTLNQ
jgi:hypothetical protein